MCVVILTKYERQQVGDGEAKQVEVGSGVQVPVCYYDDTGARVAKQPGDEDQRVDYGECQGFGKFAATGSEMRLQERVEVEFG